MHGLGNDFAVIDATKKALTLTPQTIISLANRRTGIGFDQLLLIESPKDAGHDFFYRIYNADGSEVSQCGNGARCIAQYIFLEKLTHKSIIRVATLSGLMELKDEKNGQITVVMGRPEFDPYKIPFLTGREQSLYQLQIDQDFVEFGAVSLGNPHIVLEVLDIATAPVLKLGPVLQSHEVFPEKVNVGFMQIISPNQIAVRVYERGAGETLACGSGACAAVAVGRRIGKLQGEVQVDLLGGQLTVQWPSLQGPISMTGPAVTVFKGEIAL